jgi:ABC-type nitrate/sulfonate/bicarbonate transport system substrate-binding protein
VKLRHRCAADSSLAKEIGSKYGGEMIISKILTGACLVLALFSFAGMLHAQTQKIRISLSSRSNTNTSYYVAQARGFFKDEGLEVEFIQINPRLGAMAVLNGDVTFTTSFVSTFRGIVLGLPMKSVFILLK